ncbi:MAG: LptF/LptG family permease [Bacteriovoracaceae bacterium]|jgi:lipopolysaccharide export system permease protein|nr:LptF/LptG family permease [Bacteriovoracaceae bacterium]
MLKLYRVYLAAHYVVPLVTSTLFFVIFLLTFELFRIMQLMSSSDVSFNFILSMILDIGVTLIPMALPLSVFFSTIFCINKLSGDSEYIALRSFGLKKLQIMGPFLIVGFIMAANIYFLTQQLVPNAHSNLRRKINIISSASLIQGIKSGQFFTTIPNVTMFPEKVDETTKELTNVFLQIYTPANKEEKVIHAKSGKILHEKDEQTGFETFKLYLKNGNITNSIKGKNDVQKILFEEYTLPISSQKFSYTPSTKEIMMNGRQLKNFIDAGLDSAIKKGFKKKVYVNAKYEYWNRLNQPLMVLIFTFLGFCLGVKATRSRGQNSSGKAILVLIGYYAIFFGLVGMAKSEKIPMYLAVILPSILLIIYCIKLYRKMDWQS